MAAPSQAAAQQLDYETLRLDVEFKKGERASILEELQKCHSELLERPNDENIAATIETFQEQLDAIGELLHIWEEQLSSLHPTPVAEAEVYSSTPPTLTKPGKSGLKSTASSDDYPLYMHMARIIHSFDLHTKERLCCFECAQSYEVENLDVPNLLKCLEPPLPKVAHHPPTSAFLF